MEMEMGSPKLYVLILISTLFTHFVPLTVSQQPNFVNRFCESKERSDPYEANLNILLASFSNTTAEYGFYKSSAGRDTDTVNGIGLCRPDVSRDSCRSCMSTSGDRLKQLCPSFKEGVIYYDTCTLCYSNRSISGITESTLSYWQKTGGNFSDVTLANKELLKLLHRLRRQAASGDLHRKYAAGEAVIEFETMYALVQCTPDLSGRKCSDCLQYHIGSISVPKKGGISMGPRCNIRYDTNRFYGLLPDASSSSSPTLNGNGQNNKTTRIVLITTVSTIVLVMFVLPICFFLRRYIRMNAANNEDVLKADSLLFELGMIRDATDNFSDANKLGRGGFGDVYKGVLSDGQEVAVKRLSVGSNQGDLEFKNEVLLLAKLQHINLIKLIGFCLEGGEKLLIYELAPNSSLDHFIFNPNPIERAHLDWEKRYRIIRGIARGLQYLHQDSHLRIIHRDLKASNILLDADLNPKIADFGLAKLCSLDQTHENTRRIAGTYGYMAPEYAYRGTFSVKSDVYSFGVIVLEIVSGQKTSSQNGEELEHLVRYVWRKWREGTLVDLVDRTPGVDSSSRSEMMRCLHIGLLCVQENMISRPTMSTVVSMLNSNHVSLPIPSPPGFLLHSTTQFVDNGNNSHASGTTYSDRYSTQQLSVNGVSISVIDPR